MQNERREYESRVNRVLDYIDRSLEKKLSLEELARVASFSPFHFHRIFKCMVGETLNDYIRRIKLEKAANILAHNERTSITEIAFDCGFSSSAVFARAFKENFGMSASEWRRDGFMKMHEQYHLDKGETNSSRYNPYHSLNIRLEWHFSMFWNMQDKTYLEVWNAYDRKNPLGLDYQYGDEYPNHVKVQPYYTTPLMIAGGFGFNF